MIKRVEQRRETEHAQTEYLLISTGTISYIRRRNLIRWSNDDKVDLISDVERRFGGTMSFCNVFSHAAIHETRLNALL